MSISLQAASTSPFAARAIPQVLIVDDHPLLRRGLRALLEETRRYQVCGEADNAPAALALTEKLRPDLATVDITLKSANGIELTKSLRTQLPPLKVLVLSMHDEQVYAERALRAGAHGFLRKDQAMEQLVSALDSIREGKSFASDAVKNRILDLVLRRQTPGAVGLEGTLSDRELEVLELIGEGFSTRAIASQLRLSVKTIDSYREHLKVKLQLPRGAELVHYAVQRGKQVGLGAKPA